MTPPRCPADKLLSIIALCEPIPSMPFSHLGLSPFIDEAFPLYLPRTCESHHSNLMDWRALRMEVQESSGRAQSMITCGPVSVLNTKFIGFGLSECLSILSSFLALLFFQYSGSLRMFWKRREHTYCWTKS